MYIECLLPNRCLQPHTISSDPPYDTGAQTRLTQLHATHHQQQLDPADCDPPLLLHAADELRSSAEWAVDPAGSALLSALQLCWCCLRSILCHQLVNKPAASQHRATQGQAATLTVGLQSPALQVRGVFFKQDSSSS
jgi:hypothetical protein